jgi:hypothetical protein
LRNRVVGLNRRVRLYRCVRSQHLQRDFQSQCYMLWSQGYRNFLQKQVQQ